MSRFAARGAAALALLSLCHAASAQITKQGDAYLFRMKFTKGEKITYIVNSSAQMPGVAAAKGGMKITMPMVMTVKDVKGKIATIQLDQGPMTMNGKAGGQQKQTMELKIDDRGKPVGNAAPAQSVTANLPDKPLKVGESYTSTNNISVMGQQMSVKTTNKLLGIKKVGSRNVAAFATTTSGSGAIALSGSGTAYLDMADGSLVSMAMNQKMTAGKPPQQQTINNAVTLTRK